VCSLSRLVHIHDVSPAVEVAADFRPLPFHYLLLAYKMFCKCIVTYLIPNHTLLLVIAIIDPTAVRALSGHAARVHKHRAPPRARMLRKWPAASPRHPAPISRLPVCSTAVDPLRILRRPPRATTPGRPWVNPPVGRPPRRRAPMSLDPRGGPPSSLSRMGRGKRRGCREHRSSAGHLRASRVKRSVVYRLCDSLREGQGAATTHLLVALTVLSVVKFVL
jgi:hypothetical protein